MMRCVFFAAAAIFLSFGSVAAAVKPCAELKAKIAAKLDSKGVKDYELSISARHEKAAGKIIGTCEDGSKQIIYNRQQRSGAAVQQQPAAANEKAAQQEQPVPVVAVRMVPATTEEPSQATNSIKACAELKAELVARLDSKGVKNYTLIVLNKSEGSPGQVIGTCESGSKKIIYAKTR